MNPRLAVVLVFALVVVLVFVGYLLERRRAIRKREVAELEHLLGIARERMIAYERLLDDIADVAAAGIGLDVSAEQIKVLLQRHATKEIE